MESLTTGLASSNLGGGPKFKIQQSIPSGCIKKAPHAIVRSAELNEGIEIKRRFGEGSKPLFARDDIAVNQQTVGVPCVSIHDNSSAASTKTKTNKRNTSTESSSPERYRHRDKKHTSSPSGRHKSSERSSRDKYVRCSGTTKSGKYKRKNKSKTRSPSPLKKKPTEKVPYYRDEARERDRLRRLYGSKDRGRSRSRSISSSNKYNAVSKRRINSPKRRRSSSRDNYHRQTSSYRNSRREYRCRRSHTRSRTRSPKRRDRDNHKHSSRDRDKELRDNTSTVAATVIQPTPQFIHIPVAVPAEYAYSFAGWPTPQPSWTPSHRPPLPSHFSPYPMYPMMAPIRPPHQMGYGALPPSLTYGPMQGSGYRSNVPHRFPLAKHNTYNYQPRSKKPSS